EGEEANTTAPEKNVAPSPTIATPPPPSGSGSSMAVVAAMISAVAAGGVFYLWKEVSTVQNTVATRSNSGVDQGQLDTLQKTLDQTFQASVTKSAAELTAVINETRG
ncbi:MAG: hypothetical protein FD130_1317, partial [Halothiobacillaceae bacterium]